MRVQPDGRPRMTLSAPGAPSPQCECLYERPGAACQPVEPRILGRWTLAHPPSRTRMPLRLPMSMGQRPGARAFLRRPSSASRPQPPTSASLRCLLRLELPLGPRSMSVRLPLLPVTRAHRLPFRPPRHRPPRKCHQHTHSLPMSVRLRFPRSHLHPWPESWKCWLIWMSSRVDHAPGGPLSVPCG
ncbi:hypothetical protein C8Q76DRAFT_441744 [Earliella scabrosa]|nr:hypothetical protein C8Q76DRAFT_441744 [Earliella scabrosa]